MIIGATMQKKFWLTGALALTLAGGASAQETATDDQGATKLDRILLTPNRTPTEKSKVGSKVEQVSKEEIEQKSLPTVIDYLRLLPGVSISSGGGPGSDSSLSIRGLPQRYVKTLYNGIDISDPTSTQVQTAYQYLLTGGTDTIEVLKGSQGTLYGSDAIAGVVSISSLGGIDIGVHHEVEAEGGSFGTVRGRYGLQAANEASKFALNVTGLSTDGISSADRRDGNLERDGFKEGMFDVNGEYRFSDSFSVFGSGLYIKAKSDFDDSDPVQDNPFNFNRSEQLAGRFGFNLDLMDGRLKNTVSAQGLKIDRDIHSVSPMFGPFDGNFLGTRQKIDYQGSFEATDRFLLQYGLDHEKQNAKATDNGGTDTDDSFSLTGLWAQAVVEPIDDLTFTGGLRHDDHSAFGGHTTYRGTGSYLVDATGTRLHASFGTGFRAPSLYELYAPFFGNTALQPETSVSFDAGVEQSFLDGRLTADVTYFDLKVDDLIIFNNGTFVYEQVPGTSRSRGVETSFTYAATDWLDLGGSYTYTDARSDTGIRTVRVPRHAVVVSAGVTPAEKWTVSADTKFVSDVVDVDNGVEVPLKDYVLVNAKVAYQLSESTQVYLRGENLFDQHYQTVAGFGTPGISVFAGMKAKF